MDWNDLNWSMEDMSNFVRHMFFALCAVVSVMGLIIERIEREESRK